MNIKEGLAMSRQEMPAVDRQKLELEKKPSIGTVVIVVSIDPNKDGENARDPRIWTILEKRSKTETDRMVGQISFPADTRKNGEDKFSNMLGALPEFSDNSELIRNLVRMPSSYIEGKISVKNNPADLAVLIMNDIPKEPITPLDKDEVSANGFISLANLKKENNENPSRLRSFVKQIIDMEATDKIIYGVVEDYFLHPEERISLSTILSPNISLSEFYHKREQLPDVIGNSGVIYQAKNSN